MELYKIPNSDVIKLFCDKHNKVGREVVLKHHISKNLSLPILEHEPTIASLHQTEYNSPYPSPALFPSSPINPSNKPITRSSIPSIKPFILKSSPQKPLMKVEPMIPLLKISPKKPLIKPDPFPSQHFQPRSLPQYYIPPCLKPIVPLNMATYDEIKDFLLEYFKKSNQEIS